MIRTSETVATALEQGMPVVALESTVLAHGLPRPRNLEVAEGLEAVVRGHGAVAATVAVLRGIPRVGLAADEVRNLCSRDDVLKLSTRDLPLAVARAADGATTVAATMWISAQVGVKVFATGGIGGVHRGALPDVSADLTELGRTRQVVVCAGAKAILDLPATREALETGGVLVVGWRTGEMPAFYSRESGLQVDVRVEDEREVAGLWRAQQALGTPGALLLCVPPPPEHALPAREVEGHVAAAVATAESAGIMGKALTPHLLAELARRTEGRSLDANVALLRENAQVAARVAVALRET